VEEYEHLHFLWAKGLDKVVYPAVLGLLSEFNEVWSDASTDLTSPATETFRSVPWISQEAIKASRLPSSKTDYIIRRSILSDATAKN
jgi:hypothetical protein